MQTNLIKTVLILTSSKAFSIDLHSSGRTDDAALDDLASPCSEKARMMVVCGKPPFTGAIAIFLTNLARVKKKTTPLGIFLNANLNPSHWQQLKASASTAHCEAQRQDHRNPTQESFTLKETEGKTAIKPLIIWSLADR